MSGINKVIIVGNLGRDPETRDLQNGGIVTTLSVATSEEWKDRQTGEKRERTEWHRVVIFNPGLAKVAANYLKKGSRVYLEGKLQTRKWTDSNGHDKYTTEIVLQPYQGVLEMLGGAPAGDHQEGWGSPDSAPQTNGATVPPAAMLPNGAGTSSSIELDDEIPF